MNWVLLLKRKIQKENLLILILKKETSSVIIDSLKICFESNSDIFPNQFTINLTSIETNELDVVTFIKMFKHSLDHPVTSSDIYSFDKNSQKIQRIQNLKEIVTF